VVYIVGSCTSIFEFKSLLSLGEDIQPMHLHHLQLCNDDGNLKTGLQPFLHVTTSLAAVEERERDSSWSRPSVDIPIPLPGDSRTLAREDRVPSLEHYSRGRLFADRRSKDIVLVVTDVEVDSTIYILL
jgi:hypothetical protein